MTGRSQSPNDLQPRSRSRNGRPRPARGTWFYVIGLVFATHVVASTTATATGTASTPASAPATASATCPASATGPASTPASATGPAPAPVSTSIDDNAFDVPRFPVEPTLSGPKTEHGCTIARAWLSYRKADGREIGGWAADLYIAGARTKLPRGAEEELRPAGPPPASPRRALIVVLPVGGLGKNAGASFARALARDGFIVLYLHAPPPEAEGVVLHSLRGTSRSLTEDVANLRRAIAWASRLPGIDPGRIGVLGMSRGAIVTALAAQLDARLTPILVLGGADLPGLFRDSTLDRVKKLRLKEAARAGGDIGEGQRRAASILANVDPASRPGRLDPHRTLLINARYDRVIPRAQGFALREAAGGATQVWLPSGHSTGLLFMRRIRKLVRAHFRRTLG